MSQKFLITIPATMALSFEIEAESESEATAKAWQIDFGLDVKPQFGAAECDMPEITQFELHAEVVRGNIFFGVLDKLTVEKL